MPRVPGAPDPNAALGGGIGARARPSQVAVIDAQLATPQLSTPQFSTPQLRAQQMRPVEGDPSAIKHIELSDRGAQQWGQMGNALGSAADALGRSVMNYQTKVNAAVVDDAMNQARDAAARLTFGHKDEQTGQIVGGYKNLTGVDAIRRPGDKSLDDEVTGQFKEVLNGISAKLTNPDQQRAFQMQANDVGAGLRQGALVHQADQFDRYYQGVYTAQTANLTTQFATLEPGDLAGQKKTMEQIEQAVGTLAIHNGASAEELQVGLRGARSAAVNGLFEQAMTQKKYDTAQALLNQWSSQIDPNAAAKMKSMLDGHVAIQVGEQIADKAWTSWGAPHYQAGDSDRAFNVVLQTENRGNVRQADNGKTVTSPKGAFGVAQLMPDTAALVAKKLGKPELAELAKQPTQAGEAANRVLGRAYFNGLVTQFNGDVEKAFAAYNAGPGALVGGKDSKGNRMEGALKWAARTGGDWHNAPDLHQETRDYVTYAMKSWGSGEGKPPKPSREQLYAQVDAQITDPDARRAAYSKLDRHFSNAEADERDTSESAYAEGIRVVTESGGNANAISPELRGRMKPEQYTTLLGLAKNTAEGQYRVSDRAAYYTAMDPTAMRAMNQNQLEALRVNLSEQDFKTAANLWQDLHSPQPGKGPESLDVPAVDGLLKTHLQYMGVNVSPKKGDTAAEARLGAIQQFAHQYVLDQQRQTGKKFTDYGELEKTINGLFLKNQDFKNTVLGLTAGRGSQTVITAQVKDIPADQLKQIKNTLRNGDPKLGFKGFGRDPSDAEILQAYFRHQFYGG